MRLRAGTVVSFLSFQFSFFSSSFFLEEVHYKLTRVGRYASTIHASAFPPSQLSHSLPYIYRFFLSFLVIFDTRYTAVYKIVVRSVKGLYLFSSVQESSFLVEGFLSENCFPFFLILSGAYRFCETAHRTPPSVQKTRHYVCRSGLCSTVHLVSHFGLLTTTELS